MIIGTLATTADCRDGNCPTAWLTDRGTVVVQGYATSNASVVEVPESILRQAATAIRERSLAAPLRIPSQRDVGSGISRALSGNLAVRGDVDTHDVAELTVPDREAAVEVEARTIIDDLHRLSALQEVV